MNKSDVARLVKIEERIMQIAHEDMGLETCPIEFDIIPPQKMLEIMAYRIPTNVSSWKYGRDYERLRTMYENMDPGLPYEVVINSDPSRAYLMKSNTFAVQALVIAHVVGHVAFFTMNKYFQNTRKDIIEVLGQAHKRFNGYEKLYGVGEVEKMIDAGHSVQFHSSPFESETEDEKRDRIFEQMKRDFSNPNKSLFSDLTKSDEVDTKNKEDIELHNQRLWKALRMRTPVEPTEDILRYIIDNSTILEDWQKDVLEVLRIEGQYYWPQQKTKYMNEGFATYVHEHIMDKLFTEEMLTSDEHAEYNYSNSLVKATNPVSMNPYLIGSKIWEDVEMRWDKGRHGSEWENCDVHKEKEEWDTKEKGEGYKKILQTLRSYTDWFFMQDFLTPDLIDDLNLYIYVTREDRFVKEWVRTRHNAKQMIKPIISSFSASVSPNIDIVDGNYQQRGELVLNHRYSGMGLDQSYTVETLKHICQMWGRKCFLKTKKGNGDIIYVVSYNKGNVKSETPLQTVVKPPGGLSMNIMNPMEKLKPHEDNRVIDID
jgi:stage V sporulation protein R